jgi:CO dehydrogenase/acetyl-CoA synthase beta subunit
MAKKMVLVDKPHLEELMIRDLQDREASKWMRPADEKLKTDLNAQIKNELLNLLSSDDIKAKMYNQQLQRFLNLKKQQPIVEPAFEEEEEIKERPKRRKRSAVHVMKTRSTKRKPIKKLQWEEW